MTVTLTSKHLVCSFSDFVDSLKGKYSVQLIDYYINENCSQIKVVSTIKNLKSCKYVGSDSEYLIFEDSKGKFYSFGKEEFRLQTQILWPMFDSKNTILLRTDKYDFFNLAPYCIETDKTQVVNVDESNLEMIKDVFEKYFNLKTSSINDLRNEKVKTSRSVGFISISYNKNSVKVSDRNFYESNSMFILNNNSELILISK